MIDEQTAMYALPILVCQKCRKRWFPRYLNPPKVCPRCKTKKWNRQDTTPKEPHAQIEVS